MKTCVYFAVSRVHYSAYTWRITAKTLTVCIISEEENPASMNNQVNLNGLSIL